MLVLRLSCSIFAALVCAAALPVSASAAGAAERPRVKILSASWGTENQVGCPTGEKGLDNIPGTFNWFVRRSTIRPSDFRIVRNDGSVATPTCALQFPPDERDERQTVNLIGNFGDSVSGPRPVSVRVVGALQGRAPTARRWRRMPRTLKAEVEPLSGGPFIVDAWQLTPALYRRDRNRCKVGNTFIRVMWSNGLTAFPSGKEVGRRVVRSYRAKYKLRNGRIVSVTPRAVADLYDHPNVANADNMHDLCLSLPRCSGRLTGINIGGRLIQDPNGDPNPRQKFSVR